MINEIKFLHDDSINVLKQLEDNSIDAIVTDPPYEYLNHKLDRRFVKSEVLEQWDRVVKDDGFIVFFGRGESFHEINYLLNNLGWKFKEEVIWNKRSVTSPFLPLSRVHETVSLLSKNGKIRKNKIPYEEVKKYQLDRMQNDLKRIVSGLGNQKSLMSINYFLENQKVLNDKQNKPKFGVTVSHNFKTTDQAAGALQSIIKGLNEQSIMEVARDGRKITVHPTQKPIRLMERLINLASDEGDVILDPFMGSGSTGLAAKNTNRNFIGIEIDDEYFEKANSRLSER